MGLSFETHYQNYHRVLNRAVWSNLKASRILLGLLINAFVPTGPLILGLDDTIERRKGAKIAAKGIYRNPVRSSQSHFVKTSGLRFLLVRQHLTGYSRWLCLMLLVPVPFASRVWALPFMTVLAASLRYNTEQGKPHRKLTDWARVMLRTVQRWFPERQLVVVADSAYAVIDWLAGLQKLSAPITVITRLRLDAALYKPVGERKAGQKGRPGVKGIRLPTLAGLLEDPETVWTRIRVLNWYGQGDRDVEISSQRAVWYHKGIQPVNIRWVLIRDPTGKFKSQALLCTDLMLEPTLILEWFVLRWCVEVTFEESRAHLGVESQRQWSGLAIARTTPVLFGL
jgi:DDE superfamily endonuclease